ncbi:MAG: hypothetical protein J5892_01145 [Bacilli bacterium]|nr:hypothetical protein [Bacilli bacterium]
MEQIDYRDKFFHGILIDEVCRDDVVYEKLENILKTGVLYSRGAFKDHNISNGYLSYSYDHFWNHENEVCLAAYPEIGKYSFKNKGGIDVDAYLLFACRTSLIFSDELLKDYQVRKGALDNEYYLTGNIDLNKYLVGIGHPGLHVRMELNILYYYFKYCNNEITLDEFLLRSGEGLGANPDKYDLKKIPNSAEVINEWARYTRDKIDGKRKLELEVYDPEYYLYEQEWYSRVKEIADRYNVKLYDSNGIFIKDKDTMLNEVKEMIAYVLEEYYRTDEERLAYKIKKLEAQGVKYYIE